MVAGQNGAGKPEFYGRLPPIIVAGVDRFANIDLIAQSLVALRSVIRVVPFSADLLWPGPP